MSHGPWLDLAHATYRDSAELHHALTHPHPSRNFSHPPPLAPLVADFVRDDATLDTRRSIRLILARCDVARADPAVARAVASLRAFLHVAARDSVNVPSAAEALRLLAIIARAAGLGHVDDPDGLFLVVLHLAQAPDPLLAAAAADALAPLMALVVSAAGGAIEATVDACVGAMFSVTLPDHIRPTIVHTAAAFPRRTLDDLLSTSDTVLEVVENFPTLPTLQSALDVVDRLIPEVRSMSAESQEALALALDGVARLLGWLLRRVEADHRLDAQLNVANKLRRATDTLAALIPSSDASANRSSELVLCETATRLLDILSAQVDEDDLFLGHGANGESRHTLLVSVRHRLSAELFAVLLQTFVVVLLRIDDDEFRRKMIDLQLRLTLHVLVSFKDIQPWKNSQYSFGAETAIVHSLRSVLEEPTLRQVAPYLLGTEVWRQKIAPALGGFFHFLATSVSQERWGGDRGGDTYPLIGLAGALGNLCGSLLRCIETNENTQAVRGSSLPVLSAWVGTAAALALAHDAGASCGWCLQCRVSWRFLVRFVDRQGDLLEPDQDLVSKLKRVNLTSRKPGPMTDACLRVFASIASPELVELKMSTLPLTATGLYFAGKSALTASTMRADFALSCFRCLLEKWSYQSTGALRIASWIQSLLHMCQAFLSLPVNRQLCETRQAIRALHFLELARGSLRKVGSSMNLQARYIALWHAYWRNASVLRTIEAEVGMGPGRTHALRTIENLLSYITRLTSEEYSLDVQPMILALNEGRQRLDKMEALPVVAEHIHQVKVRVPTSFFTHRPHHLRVSLSIPSPHREKGLPSFAVDVATSEEMTWFDFQYVVQASSSTRSGIATALGLKECVVEVFRVVNRSISAAPGKSPAEVPVQTVQLQPCSLERKDDVDSADPSQIVLTGCGAVRCRLNLRESQLLGARVVLRGARSDVIRPDGVQTFYVHSVTAV